MARNLKLGFFLPVLAIVTGFFVHERQRPLRNIRWVGQEPVSELNSFLDVTTVFGSSQKRGNTRVSLLLDASPDQCQAVAARLGVLAIKKLCAQVSAERIDGAAFVTMNISVGLEQMCILSGKPIPTHIAQDFILKKRSNDFDTEDNEADFIDDEDEEFLFIDPASGNLILDTGELIIQFLSLELDPYPRAQAAPTQDNTQLDNTTKDPRILLSNGGLASSLSSSFSDTSPG